MVLRHKLLAAGFAALMLASFAQAETNTVEGISGDIDKKHRGPALSINAYPEGGGAKILADAYVPNSEFVSYPIRFDFYINRRLFSSQIRTKELPGPVGVDVGNDIAPIPFNYAVVATLLHPNRQFVTTAYGVVYATDLLVQFDCTLSIADGSAVEGDYEALQVNSTQAANDALTLNFTGENSLGGKEANVTATVNVSDDTGSGSVTYTVDDSSKTISLSGEITKSDNGEIATLSLASTDQSVSLDCQ